MEVVEAAQAAGDELEFELEDEDLLPVEERYLDDGTVSSLDSVRYGIHSGYTQRFAPFVSLDMDCVTETELLAELRGPRAFVAEAAVCMVAWGALLAMLVL